MSRIAAVVESKGVNRELVLVDRNIRQVEQFTPVGDFQRRMKMVNLVQLSRYRAELLEAR